MPQSSTPEITARNNIRFQFITIVIGFALMVAKFIAWWLTNSNAILTDALESIINVLAGAFAIYSLMLAMKPRDENHPYGHGKVEFLSAGFEGGLILIAGMAIIIKGIYNLIYPQAIDKLDIGIILISISGIINYILGNLLEQRGKRANSLTLIADGKHLKADAYSSAGLLAGLTLIYLTELSWLDNVTAILFGGIILYTGFKLVRESVAGIMDEADYKLIENMVKYLAQHRHEEWIDVHNFRVIKYGSTLHVDCHVTVPYYFETQRSHDSIKVFETLVDESSESPVEVFVHVDPCEPPGNCTICQMHDCKVRQAEQQMNVQWTLENFMKDQKHHLD